MKGWHQIEAPIYLFNILPLRWVGWKFASFFEYENNRLIYFMQQILIQSFWYYLGYCNTVSQLRVCRRTCLTAGWVKIDIKTCAGNFWLYEYRCETWNRDLYTPEQHPVPVTCYILRINSSLPGRNGRHFANDVFKCIFVNETFCISIKKIHRSLLLMVQLTITRHWFR